MLMPATIPSDATFPGLRAALDPGKAAEAFSRALDEAGYAVGELTCTIERSRIKKGRKALFGYRLKGNLSGGNAFDQRAMIALYPAGDPALLPDMTKNTVEVPSVIGPGRLPIPGLSGEAWFFPNDRKVRGIVALLSERQGAVEIMHYVPEQGCTVRLIEPEGRVLYGKCRADDRGGIAARFCRDRFAPSAHLRLARIISHDPAHRLIWQEEVIGQPLDFAAVLAAPRVWAERIGLALAQFHALPQPPGLKRISFASAAQTLAARIERMATASPDLAHRLAEIANDLKRALPAEAPLVASHCDLHPANLLWDGVSFGLIDLDTAALAPAAFDYATLAAALTQKAIEAGAADTAIAAMVNALREVSEAKGVRSAQFDWSYAASLIGERLYRCTTRLKGASNQSRLRLLDLAERRLAAHA